jgi:hypothetical protein
VNDSPREPSDQWITQRVQVDPTPPQTAARWEEFAGKLLSRATEMLNRSAAEERIRFSTLYETPREGYKLQVEESVTKGTDVSRHGRSASRVETTRALYSEEEAKQKHPEMFENLLKRSQE